MMIRLVRLFSTTNETLKKDKFLALIKPPLGLTKEITAEQKKKINQQITRKMQELQSTGFSRQQILLSKSQKGIPLKLDAFFQFIKNNFNAREVYLKTNDRFTVQNVIDIALRQDIGADPSISRIRGPDVIETKGRADRLHELKQLREGKFNPDSYDGPSKFSVQGAYDELKPHQPLRHYFKPLDRYQKRKQNLKQINKYDIHWRNVELLRQFVSINGNIKSRFKNFLSDSNQVAVRKAIKTSRIMGAMPYFGRTAEPLKKNITSLEDEVQELGYQHVNLQTGHLFQTRSRSMDSLEVQLNNENDLDYKYQRMTSEGNNYKIWVNNLQKTEDEQNLKAEKYARHLKGKQVEQSSKTKQALKMNVNTVLKGITKYKALQGEEPTKVPASNDEACKLQFEQQRNEILGKISNDPLSVLSKLLSDKLKV